MSDLPTAVKQVFTDLGVVRYAYLGPYLGLI